ncbi:hypothetical protein BV898_06467 [Hypsibius exemplaris]|uniref:Chromo domain-containing protein n=1 Tax=Hypsibius exemplaris TaxID=2072580 RepID=A0A1W0WWB4_HYPEX|nr:hypothetical protein BV898_06467 [Hypsibius exemplaris]
MNTELLSTADMETMPEPLAEPKANAKAQENVPMEEAEDDDEEEEEEEGYGDEDEEMSHTSGTGGGSGGGGEDSLSKRRNELEVKEKLDPDEFIVERVLAYKKHKKIRYAKVKWQGFSEATWVPANTIFYYKTTAAPLEIESLLGMRTKKGNVEFKVHWKGLPASRDAWVRKYKIKDRMDLINEYMETHTTKATRKPPPKAKLTIETSDMIKPEVSGVKDGRNDQGIKIGRNKRIGVMKASHMTDPSAIPTVPETFPGGSSDDRRRAKLDRGGSMGSSWDGSAGSPSTSNSNADSSSFGIPETVAPHKVQTVAPPKVQTVEHLKPVAEWTATDVEDFLVRRGFPEPAAKLREKAMDGRALLENLDPAVLRTMDVLIGPSLKICKAVRDLQSLGPKTLTLG